MFRTRRHHQCRRRGVYVAWSHYRCAETEKKRKIKKTEPSGTETAALAAAAEEEEKKN